MSQPIQHRIDPARAEDFTPDWLKIRREMIVAGNYTVRSSARRCSIEMTNADCAGGTVWYFLTLPGDTTLFATVDDRAEILAILTGAKPLPQ